MLAVKPIVREIRGKKPTIWGWWPQFDSKGVPGEGKLSCFQDSLYMFLYQPPVHLLCVEAIIREISSKNPNVGLDDPILTAKGGHEGKSQLLFRLHIYGFVSKPNIIVSCKSNNNRDISRKPKFLGWWPQFDC